MIRLISLLVAIVCSWSTLWYVVWVIFITHIGICRSFTNLEGHCWEDLVGLDRLSDWWCQTLFRSALYTYQRSACYHFTPHQIVQVLPDFQSLVADRIRLTALELGPYMGGARVRHHMFTLDHILFYLVVHRLEVKEHWYTGCQWPISLVMKLTCSTIKFVYLIQLLNIFVLQRLSCIFFYKFCLLHRDTGLMLANICNNFFFSFYDDFSERKDLMRYVIS